MSGSHPVFFVGAGQSDTRDVSLETAGSKGYNLIRMDRLGLPVPPAFVLSTAFGREYQERGGRLEEGFAALLGVQLRRLENTVGRSFGGHRRPLLVSVRSGAPVSMPGMLATVLNVGLNERTVRGLVRMTGNPRLAWDSYRRLVQSYAECVHGAPAEPFQQELRLALDRDGLVTARDLDAEALRSLASEFLRIYREIVGADFPQEPMEQLVSAVEAVFRSWSSRRAQEYRRARGVSEDLHTAVCIQTMVFGNAGNRSGSGVAFTRDPGTGENRMYLDFLSSAQGEDVVSGRQLMRDASELELLLPHVAGEIDRIRRALEREFRDMQDFEFTVEEGRLYVLQTRPGARTPWAALAIAVDLVREGVAQPGEMLERLAPYDLETIERIRLATGDRHPIARATSASIGVAVGRVAFDPERASKLAELGEGVILVRPDIVTDDIAGLLVVDGILTAHGGRTSHAAVVARQLGKVCLVGCRDLTIDQSGRRCWFKEHPVSEGDFVSLDADSGDVYPGRLQVSRERPLQALREVNGWRRS